jgi:hypothetical protein
VKRVFDSVVFVLCIAIAGCGSGASKVGSGAGGSSGGAGASAGTGGTNGDAAVDGGSCPFTACGGDIVGIWHFASSCGSVSTSSCPPPLSIVIEHETAQATYTFRSDGTFMNALSGDFSETVRYPLACLPSVTDGGTTQTCADYQNAVQASIAQADAGSFGETFTCSMDVNQTCLCDEAFTNIPPQTATGSYAVSGDQVIVTASVDGGVGDAGAPASVPYCVSGNTLTLYFTGDATVAGAFVLTLTR